MLKQIFYQKSINQINFLTIVFTALLTSIFTLVILTTIYKDHQKEIKDLEESFFKAQKEAVVNETNRALNYIDYKYKNCSHKSLEDLKREIVDAIEHMRNERDDNRYVFIYTFEGVNIADPILKDNKGKNLLYLKDPNGKSVIKELIEVSQTKEGGFVDYIWNKPLSNKLSAKISYAKAYEPLGWMVGSGVYLKDIEKVIQEKKNNYSKKISKYTFEILSLTMLLFISGMIIYRFFTKLIQSEIDRIRVNLKNAPIECEGIDPRETMFKEFKEIIFSVNEMITDIRQKREALEDLNKNLEFKVEEKTKKLQESKEYVENLLKKQDNFIKTSIHEINTPLSIIISNIELFTMKHGKDSYLTKIEAASKIINNVFNDLSYMLKKDRLIYKKASLNFSDFLFFRIEFFSEIANGANTAFNTDIDENISIDFNEIHLQRIVDNNLSNSIKYSKKDTPIKISLKKEKQKIYLRFENISETVIQEEEKIFDEFYRESSSRGGFGLGLKIVKDICDENSVIISVKSNVEKTTFTYIFKESI